MKFKAGLSVKFYLVTVLLSGLVVFGWYGVWFLNANTILMEDDTPMTADTKLIFTILLCVIIASWSVSLLTLIRQIIMGCAFKIDEIGIHSTVTAMLIFSLIFVIPVRTIPFEAVTKVEREEGHIVLHIDKSKVESYPLLSFFIRKEYRLFSGFTTAKNEEIESCLRNFIEIPE